MEDNLITPDVMLVTKNVMVPLALPVPRNKLFITPCVLRKKTKIIRARKNRLVPKQTLRNAENMMKQSNEELLRSTDYLANNYDSSIDWEQDLKESYELLYSQGITLSDTHFSDSSKEEKTRQTYLSQSFPKTVANSVENYKESLLIFDLQDKTTDEANGEEILSEKSKKNDIGMLEKNDELRILDANNFAYEYNDSGNTELRRCISSELNSKYSTFIDKERDKQLKSNECEMKYSWQDLDNWVPPSAKKKITEINKQSELSREKELDCKVTYSWQIIGTGAQTSYELIQSLLPKAEEGEKKRSKEAINYPLSVKYSWQIIGTGTQVSFLESTKNSLPFDKDYWDGKILMPRKRYAEGLNCKKVPNYERQPKADKYKILYSERTQTLADKSHQIELSDCRVKYSWQNLTKLYLRNKVKKSP